MKVFAPESSFASKVNFVDANNVVVGFDMGQDCCETFGYLLTDKIPSTPEDAQVTAEELEPYVFDIGYRHANAVPDNDGGGSATFRLVAEGLPDRYLTLYNHHNGYYAHGFDMKQGDRVIVDDSI
jgi:hypothetical protein